VFSHERIVVFSGTQNRIVHDFDANPYPEGMVVEGFAVLVRAPWEVADHQEWDLVVNSSGHKLFVQALMVRLGDWPGGLAPWFVLGNVHLGHKVTHFEQAVALRSALLEYRDKCPRPQNCIGIVVAGDYNAWRYRPRDGVRDAGMVPWEVHVDG